MSFWVVFCRTGNQSGVADGSCDAVTFLLCILAASSKLNFVTQVSSTFRIADVCSENLQCLPERHYMILAQLVLNFKPKSDVL